jgi:hypothetical protein
MTTKNPEWIEGKCRFLSGGNQCTESQQGKSWFCVEHQQAFVDITNENLLEMHAASVIEAVEPKNKILHMSDDPTGKDKLSNTWHELIQRGHTPNDIQTAVGKILQKSDAIKELKKQIR